MEASRNVNPSAKDHSSLYCTYFSHSLQNPETPLAPFSSRARETCTVSPYVSTQVAFHHLWPAVQMKRLENPKFRLYHSNYHRIDDTFWLGVERS
ncbi:hypothetical protein AVEN_177559-1 [Araneus ventricosus]|uniref:Uncharacterized protein n=1 Tax=Araneus ventricosus TaxID=182803 RepID=A0A4Y2QRT0_ARAVE|nr:hypothetical protein AVEN_177559-1 [Araneus ventricosus]